MSAASAWLSARRPAAPALLAERLKQALGNVSPIPERIDEVLLGAGELLLARLLRGGCATRAAAHDLLTIDALVTYAFEAATEDDPSSVEDRAAAAMRRIAKLGLEGAA
jgi:hypothetical protein